MAVPVPQNYYTGDTGGATATFVQLVRPGPGITPTGDFLMMIVGSDANNSPDWLPYAGWNLEVNINAAVSDCNLAIYWRIADGTEPGAENPAGTGSLERWGYYFYITGVDSTSPIHLVGAANHEVASAWNVPGLTTTVNDCLIYAAWAFDGGDGAPFTATGTDWVQYPDNTSGTGGNDACGGLAQKDQASPGNTGDVAVSASASDGTSSIQIALKGESGSTTLLTLTNTAIGVAVSSSLKTFIKSLSITATGAIVRNQLSTFYKALSNTGNAIVTFTKANVIQKTLTVISSGIVTFTQSNVLGKVFNIVATGVTTFAQASVIGRVFNIVATGTVNAVRVTTFNISSAVTAIATPVFTRIATIYKVFSNTAIGTASVVKKVIKAFSVVATAAVTAINALLSSAVSAVTAIGIVSSVVTFIAATPDTVTLHVRRLKSMIYRALNLSIFKKRFR